MLLIIACSTGFHAYLGSNYNKNCMNPTSSPYPTRSPLTPSTPLQTRRQNVGSSTTERYIVTLPTQPTFGTTIPPKTGCDKAPILWMERLHLITTGICVLLSIIMLLLHLARRDLSEHPTFRGVVSHCKSLLSKKRMRISPSLPLIGFWIPLFRINMANRLSNIYDLQRLQN